MTEIVVVAAILFGIFFVIKSVKVISKEPVRGLVELMWGLMLIIGILLMKEV